MIETIVLLVAVVWLVCLIGMYIIPWLGVATAIALAMISLVSIVPAPPDTVTCFGGSPPIVAVVCTGKEQK